MANSQLRKRSIPPLRLVCSLALQVSATYQMWSMKHGLNLSLELFMPLSPQIKQHKAGHKSNADQDNLYEAASFGLAVVEYP